jgi:hypothetical protein
MSKILRRVLAYAVNIVRDDTYHSSSRSIQMHRRISSHANNQVKVITPSCDSPVMNNYEKTGHYLYCQAESKVHMNYRTDVQGAITPVSLKSN